MNYQHAQDQLLPALQQGLGHYKLSATPKQQDQLLAFVAAIAKWNKVHNLTAITSPADMLTKHILDSLAVLPHLPSRGRILDVGTGAGLPGVPLAIMAPGLDFVLLDKCQKKIAFIQHAITQLGLANICAEHSRVEQYQGADLFNVVVSRAYASLAQMILSCARLCYQDGFFLAMKGKIEQAGIESLPDGYQLTKIEAVAVPGQIGERCLVFVSKKIAQ